MATYNTGAFQIFAGGWETPACKTAQVLVRETRTRATGKIWNAPHLMGFKNLLSYVSIVSENVDYEVAWLVDMNVIRLSF